jgi:hypothetical protein
MKIDNVSFGKGFVESFKTDKEFFEHMEGEGYKHIFEGKNRKEQLKKVYDLHHKKSEKPKAEKPKD